MCQGTGTLPVLLHLVLKYKKLMPSMCLQHRNLGLVSKEMHFNRLNKRKFLLSAPSAMNSRKLTDAILQDSWQLLQVIEHTQFPVPVVGRHPAPCRVRCQRRRLPQNRCSPEAAKAPGACQFTLQIPADSKLGYLCLPPR